jgi:hypothetical protein
VDSHHLYDIDADPDEDENRAGARTKRDMVDLLRAALDAVDAPSDQFERLGIA